MSAQPASSGASWHDPDAGAKRPALSLYESANSPATPTDGARLADLRTELAAAVVAADLALMQEQMEHWRDLALERERAITLADATIDALSETIAAMSRETLPSHHDDEVNLVVWPRPPELANVPPEVREAALHYRARTRSASASRRWFEHRR